jgi:hypothetical protein
MILQRCEARASIGLRAIRHAFFIVTLVTAHAPRRLALAMADTASKFYKPGSGF